MYIDLINSDKRIKLCRRGYSYLKKKNLAEGWRLHSAGYAVLQFTRFGKIQTLYMHKLLADQFISKPTDKGKKLFVRMINSSKLDCRLENLEWATMSELRRQQSGTAGYRGVSRDGNKYRAVLYDEGKRIYLGVFTTAEEAAKAYNDESQRRFGNTKSLNHLPHPVDAE
jgi:AP2 domain